MLKFILGKNRLKFMLSFCGLSENLSFSEASEAALLSFNEGSVLVSLLEALQLAKSDKGLLLIIGRFIFHCIHELLDFDQQ